MKRSKILYILSFFLGLSLTNLGAQQLPTIPFSSGGSGSGGSSLPDPVTVAHGGTSLTTLTAHNVYVGNGTSAPTAVAGGTNCLLFWTTSSSDPSCTNSLAGLTLTSLTVNGAAISGTTPTVSWTGSFSGGAAGPYFSIATTGGGGSSKIFNISDDSVDLITGWGDRYVYIYQLYIPPGGFLEFGSTGYLSAPSGAINFGSGRQRGFSSTTLSRASGFGTNADASFATGSTQWSFDLNIGTGGSPTSGVINLPTATHGWICSVWDITTPADVTYQSAYTASTATFTTTIAWTANDHIYGKCDPF